MKDYFGKDASRLLKKKLYLFDMDGTIYLENRLFDGVLELFKKIKADGGRYVFITNNSSKSVKDYLKKVRKMGIEASDENFFTSTQAAIMLLKEKHANETIYAQGTKSFIKELKKSKLTIVTKYDPTATVVLIGNDLEVTGEKLRNTCELLTNHEVAYYGTNPDWVCPTSFGYVPDCGSMSEGIARATGKSPVFIGKPEPTMIYAAMEKFGAKKEETAVFGDRLYTDIASGINAGVDAVFVLSGEATLEDLAKATGAEVPTFVFESVKDLLS